MPGAGHGTDPFVVGDSGHRQHLYLESEGSAGQIPCKGGTEEGELRAEMLARPGRREFAGQDIAHRTAAQGHLEGAQAIGGKTMKELQPPLA